LAAEQSNWRQTVRGFDAEMKAGERMTVLRVIVRSTARALDLLRTVDMSAEGAAVVVRNRTLQKWLASRYPWACVVAASDISPRVLPRRTAREPA